VSDCALRAVLLGLIALLRAYNVLSPATYVGLLAASSLMFAWGLAGRYTVLTQLVHPEAALAANALHTAISSATIVVGPGLAGLLVALWGAGPLIGLDGASYALLAIVVWRSKPSAETTARLAAAALEASESGRALGGISLMRRHGIIGIVLLTWVFYLLYGPIEVALPVHVSQELHHGAGLLGLYWALFGAGAAIGSLSSGLLRRFPIWPTSLVIVALWGLCLVPFWFSAPVIVTMLFFGLGGLVYGPFVPLTYGLIQDRVAPHLQATVMAARGAVLTVAAPVGTAFGGPITAALGARSTLAISGIATVAATVIIGAAGPLRQRWSHAPPQPSPP
jgi:predicted MFS family arabinose efflux permease